ncbi:MAG: DNA-processing protein DprA, partial [Lachnospiraceae bacterium]|nr:DNA-processing protein DprA [Lachnospiraceae bacterium]
MYQCKRCDESLPLRLLSGQEATADFALEQGREIYVFPGRYDDALSKGTNRLIYQGAGIILSPEEFVADILSIKDTALSFSKDSSSAKGSNLEN